MSIARIGDMNHWRYPLVARMPRFAAVALSLLVFATASREVRADDASGPNASASPSVLSVGVEVWSGLWPANGGTSLALGGALYGRYRALPYLSLGAAVSRLGHDQNSSCQDASCATAHATLAGITARYHRSGDNAFDPWLQIGVGAGFSEESSLVPNSAVLHYALDRDVVGPWFESKGGLDYHIGLLAIGVDTRTILFGDPFHFFPGVGLHFEGRW